MSESDRVPFSKLTAVGKALNGVAATAAFASLPGFAEARRTAMQLEQWRDVYGEEFVAAVIDHNRTHPEDLDRSFRRVHDKWLADHRVVIVAPTYQRFVTWATAINTDPWIHPNARHVKVIVSGEDAAKSLRGTRPGPGDRLIVLGYPERSQDFYLISNILRETGWAKQ